MLLLLLLLTLVVGEASVEGVSVYFFYCSLWLIMIDTAMEVCKSHMIVVSYATITTTPVNKNNTPDTDNRMNDTDEAYYIVSCSRYRSRFTLSNIYMAFKATLKLEYIVSHCKHTHMSETYIMLLVKLLEGGGAFKNSNLSHFRVKIL